MKRLFGITAIVLMLGAQQATQPASQPELPPHIERFITGTARKTADRIATLRPEIDDATKQLAAMRKGRVDPNVGYPVIEGTDTKPWRFSSKEDKTEAIAAAQQRLEKWRVELRDLLAGTRFVYQPLDAADIEVGDVGMFAMKALLPPGTVSLKYSYALQRTPSIMQIVDDSNMLIIVDIEERPGKHRDSEPIWVRGVSTRGLVDGKAIDLGDRAFVVVDPVRYEAVFGQRTVACIEAIDLAQWRAAIDAEVVARMKP